MTLTRRSLIGSAAFGFSLAALPPVRLRAQTAPLTRPIPSTGEQIPCVGLGTWITFNVGDDATLQAECTEVMAAFFAGGGRMVDSSPMYGSSQAVIGRGLAELGRAGTVFSAEKVWTSSDANGPTQIEQTRRLWGVERFDLLQVHNLLGWEAHLDTLFAMKAAGRLRYVGITTSEGRRHDLVEQIMRRHPLDFVQFSYNLVDRDAEKRLLPLAAERGIAVIVNRPFQQGALTRRLDGEPLPDWAGEIGAASWAQLIMKFILADPAVTVVIPATTRVDHVRENLAAAGGPWPDPKMRERIATHIGAL